MLCLLHAEFYSVNTAQLKARVRPRHAPHSQTSLTSKLKYPIFNKAKESVCFFPPFFTNNKQSILCSEAGKPPDKAASRKRVFCPHKRSSGFSIHPWLTGMGVARQSTKSRSAVCVPRYVYTLLSPLLPLCFFSGWPLVFSNPVHEAKLISV